MSLISEAFQAAATPLVQQKKAPSEKTSSAVGRSKIVSQSASGGMQQSGRGRSGGATCSAGEAAAEAATNMTSSTTTFMLLLDVLSTLLAAAVHMPAIHSSSDISNQTYNSATSAVLPITPIAPPAMGFSGAPSRPPGERSNVGTASAPLAGGDGSMSHGPDKLLSLPVLSGLLQHMRDIWRRLAPDSGEISLSVLPSLHCVARVVQSLARITAHRGGTSTGTSHDSDSTSASASRNSGGAARQEFSARLVSTTRMFLAHFPHSCLESALTPAPAASAARESDAQTRGGAGGAGMGFGGVDAHTHVHSGQRQVEALDLTLCQIAFDLSAEKTQDKSADGAKSMTMMMEVVGTTSDESAAGDNEKMVGASEGAVRARSAPVRKGGKGDEEPPLWELAGGYILGRVEQIVDSVEQAAARAVNAAGDRTSDHSHENKSEPSGTTKDASVSAQVAKKARTSSSSSIAMNTTTSSSSGAASGAASVAASVAASGAASGAASQGMGSLKLTATDCRNFEKLLVAFRPLAVSCFDSLSCDDDHAGGCATTSSECAARVAVVYDLVSYIARLVGAVQCLLPAQSSAVTQGAVGTVGSAIPPATNTETGGASTSTVSGIHAATPSRKQALLTELVQHSAACLCSFIDMLSGSAAGMLALQLDHARFYLLLVITIRDATLLQLRIMMLLRCSPLYNSKAVAASDLDHSSERGDASGSPTRAIGLLVEALLKLLRQDPSTTCAALPTANVQNKSMLADAAAVLVQTLSIFWHPVTQVENSATAGARAGAQLLPYSLLPADIRCSLLDCYYHAPCAFVQQERAKFQDTSSLLSPDATNGNVRQDITDWKEWKHYCSLEMLSRRILMCIAQQHPSTSSWPEEAHYMIQLITTRYRQCGFFYPYVGVIRELFVYASEYY